MRVTPPPVGPTKGRLPLTARPLFERPPTGGGVSLGWSLLGVATVVGLLYTHSHVRLVHQSYVLDQRLTERDALHEQCAYLEYDVMALKAPQRLKERLLTYDIKLAPPVATETLTTPPAMTQAAPQWLPRWLHLTTTTAEAQSP